jgi:hypothetical protein
MKTFAFAGLLAFALVSTPTIAQAQLDEAFREPGLWAQVGGGLATVKAECSVCRTGRTGGLHGSLAVGGSLSNRARIGVEGFFFYRSSADTSVEMQGAFAIGELQPFPDLPFTFYAGIGGARYAQLAISDLTSAVGLAFTGGIKGDLGLSRHFHLVPYLKYVQTSSLPAKFNGLPQLNEAKVSAFLFGLAVGWR